MTDSTTKVTLGEFGADRVWFTSTGIPGGLEIDLFHTDDDGERCELDATDMETVLPFAWGLEGTVNADGEWEWDGAGGPRDWRQNTVTAIKAFG